MFGAHYFGQPYYGQANAGGGLITLFTVPRLLRAYSRLVGGIRRTRAVLGFNRTTSGVG